VSVSVHRIFAFEDIDAESNAVYSRTEVSTQSFTPTPAVAEKTKVTLSGVLNALDGIVELVHALVIFTTNHPERLDPALTRPGRCDYRVELRAMTAVCAGQLVAKYLPGARLDLHDYEITPAALRELIKDAPDVEWLARKVSEVVGRKISPL
jgi:hypothetical protein